MNDNPLTTLFVHFATLSLFAVGGANAAMPEMHRIAVESMRWMIDKQFADMFAISQMSPGPNVVIVTLIGFHVVGTAIVAGLVTAAAALVGFATRLNPLLVFAAGGVLGLFGLV
jgi:chromate transporter